jgi:NADH:ubiquinone oxidoreductase subunit 6 (subunit J)
VSALSPTQLLVGYVVLTLVFAVLTVQRARRRQRWWPLWLVLALVLGPITIALLLALPPGGHRAAALRERG